MTRRRHGSNTRRDGRDVGDRLAGIVAGVRILAGSIRTSRDGAVLRLEVAWEHDPDRRPYARRPEPGRRRTAVSIPLAAAAGTDGSDRERPVLMALAHLVDELAVLTGLGMRILA